MASNTRPTVIKFYPAAPAIGYIFGRRGENLRSIGGQLNQSGDKVTIKLNDPTKTTPAQFAIISHDGDKAKQAYDWLRELEEESINGNIVSNQEGAETRENDWWSKALKKETGEETVKFTHILIKNLAGLVLGKKSSNIEQARKDHFGVDIQVTSTDKTCSITYEAAIGNADVAFKALQQIRRIERDAFAESQKRFLDSRTYVPKERVSDGLGSDGVVTLQPQDVKIQLVEN